MCHPNIMSATTLSDTYFFNDPNTFSFRMSKARDNTKSAMKKQIRQIHSFFSHVGPQPLKRFPEVSIRNRKHQTN